MSLQDRLGAPTSVTVAAGELARAVEADLEVVVVTGRSDEVQNLSREWQMDRASDKDALYSPADTDD